jgi:hypothetical protein
MIMRRNFNPEQRKLLFSLGTNFATRIPGVVGMLWFLPMLRFGLGTDNYASLLAAIALGSATTFLIGGFSTIGRRIIGSEYSNGNPAGEANAFVSLMIANVLALVLALAIIAVYCTIQASSMTILIVSGLPALGIYLTTFDNARSAYNEHYVTAMLQFGFQITIYVVGFLLPATRHNLILASLILQGHYFLASSITMFLLLRKRPYLMRGRPLIVWTVIKEGTMIAVADGFLMTTLGLSVVWLQASASGDVAAWYATTVRLFQTFLVPVVLLLMPLSSYIRILWNNKSRDQQQMYTKVTVWVGVGYGALVGLALIAVSRFYVGGLLHLPAPGNLLSIAPIFLLFGAIVTWKSYSSIAYVVFPETTHLSTWTSVTLGVSVLLAVVASITTEPLTAINVYAFTASLSILVIMFWNAGRFMRLSLKLA